jgi:hypothetical protein
MEEKRFYILVPETVQITSTFDNIDLSKTDQLDTFSEVAVKTVKMSAGRLIAQAFHIGRKIENYRVNKFLKESNGGRLKDHYEEITAIDLSVRNTKELEKVSNEIDASIDACSGIFYAEFWDTNSDVYGTTEKVHTATAVGPVTRDELENAIGHLELYK